MATTQLYYVTNRRHQGRNRWQPTGYGSEPSKDGTENLRFGRISLRFDDGKVAEILQEDCGFGNGNGERLARYFFDQRNEAKITAFAEDLPKDENESSRPRARLGSKQVFAELRDKLRNGDHVLVFVHGFDLSWWEAVASAASLQCMLNRNCDAEPRADRPTPVHVVLFTWPADGRVIPYWSYFSDRSDATVAGYAFGRGLLKLRDFLIGARQVQRRKNEPPCRRSIHLLCHAMGNFVLQNALIRTEKFSLGGRLPRIFEQIFLCAGDVAADVFQPGEAFYHLPQMARAVTIYHNRGDETMPVSDYTRGNTDRLGWDGAERPADLPDRVHQVDCSRLVTALIEHNYYHCGVVNDDIRQSIDGIPTDSRDRYREPTRHGWPNVWRLVGE